MQLARERSEADSVRQFIAAVPLRKLFVSIYSIHSIGVILRCHQMIGQYTAFLAAASLGQQIDVVHIPVEERMLVEKSCLQHNLDFDDGYQYAAAELFRLRLVSLDSDFDRTPNGRLTPEQALSAFQG